MPCNCNRENPTCEPCAICTPPGVTDLPICQPVDICENSPINMDCVTYSGEDFECLNVATGDSLISVMLNILNVYFPEEYCCALEGTVEYITTTTTTTTTSTTTSTTSTTTTSTSTTTTTTTEAPIPYDCCIPFASTIDGPALYNTTTNTVTLVGIPGFSIGKAIANTRNRIWSFTNTIGEIKEWSFTQIPFSATATRTITYDSTFYSIYSLFAIDNTTLIGIDYSNPTTSRVVSIDVTTTTAVVTVLFTMPAGRVVSGNPIYTLAGNLVIPNATLAGTNYITQYSNLNGTFDLEINLGNSQIKGLYDCAGSVYFPSAAGVLTIINTTSPYTTLQLLNPTPKELLSTSTSRDCLKLDFEGSGTPVTTTTTTTTTTVVSTFTIENLTPGTIVTGIAAPQLFSISSGQFPLTYNQILRGTQFYPSGYPITLTISTTGLTACVKLYVDNVLYDSVSIPSSTISNPTVTLPTVPAITASSKIKIVISTGSC